MLNVLVCVHCNGHSVDSWALSWWQKTALSQACMPVAAQLSFEGHAAIGWKDLQLRNIVIFIQHTENWFPAWHSYFVYFIQVLHPHSSYMYISDVFLMATYHYIVIYRISVHDYASHYQCTFYGAWITSAAIIKSPWSGMTLCFNSLPPPHQRLPPLLLQQLLFLTLEPFQLNFVYLGQWKYIG